MDIPNLSNNPIDSAGSPAKSSFSWPILLIITVVALTFGFWMSRLLPYNSGSESSSPSLLSEITGEKTISGDNLTKDDVQVGKTYGNTDKQFKDSATGVIETGSINGEGTHILNREGGVSQRVSLTSSTVDLDMFVGRKVEIKGETNASNKTAWLMDVGSLKLIE